MNEILFFIIFIIPAVFGYSVLLQSLKDKLRQPVSSAKRLTFFLVEGENAMAQLRFELMRRDYLKNNTFFIIGDMSENAKAECVRLLESQGINYITERKGKYGEL